MPGNSAENYGAPLNFDIAGMHCVACSSRLERVLSRLPGVGKASVNLAAASATVWPAGHDSDLAARVVAQTAKAGFTATPASDDASASQWEKNRQAAAAERAGRLARLWPMLAFTVPLLFVSMGHMAGLKLPDWLEPHQSPRAFILVQFFLTAPVVWLGRHFYVDGLTAIWRKSPNMDSLVAVGTGAAFIYSLVESCLGLWGDDPVSHAMRLYYESCAVLLTMIELGQYLEFSAKRKAGDAIGSLMGIAPDSALLLSGDNLNEIPVAQVKIGDRLLVRPGARVPVDGIIAEGASAVDLSLMTGESMPVPVNVGDALVAGSVNGEGSLVMTATAVGKNTRLARIIRLVRDAQGSRAPIARLADRVSYYFVPAVMLFAVAAALAWLIFSAQPFTAALTVFVAVLVMACPCAMGLATPMSIMVGTSRGAQMGVLIKNGAALERACKIKILCLDKTGTLTTGKPELTDIFLEAGARSLNRSDILAMGASLEARSEHPLGAAIIRAAASQNCPGLAVGDVEIAPGLGICGKVVLDGGQWTIIVGSAAFMSSKNIPVSPSVQARLQSLAQTGHTPLLVALGQNQEPEIAAVLALADQLRPETPDVARRLRAMGIRLIMLTGDNALTARAIARKAGIDECEAQLLPAQKADFIKSLQQGGHVVGMVGDGLNDAPALAVADVGMAAGTGVDVSAEAGDIVLMRGGMRAVLDALRLSAATMRNIRQNLGWAFGYNILGLPVAAGMLAVFGGPMLSPMLAGTAMALSSFSVVTNALRLRWFGRKKG